ncbi:MAG TPA: hypothetical protein VGD08_20905 [Stellaceae bacterium]
MDIDLDDLLVPILLLTHAAAFLIGYATRAYRSRLKRRRYRVPLG